MAETWQLGDEPPLWNSVGFNIQIGFGFDVLHCVILEVSVTLPLLPSLKVYQG